jgi:D-amino peptidase
MKVFISVDMEGIACVSAREEVTKGETDYAPAQAQMTAEVAAACDGCFTGGADLIYIKDAHWTGRNLDATKLGAPSGKSLRLIRGWSGHPFSMVQGLDETFEAALFIGYHSAAGRAGNPLAHTLSSRVLAQVRINERVASEFLIYSWAASLVKVPVVFLSGDQALCDEARKTNPTLETVAIFEGQGPSIVSLSPQEAVGRIQQGALQALRRRDRTVLALPADFQVELDFRDQAEAYRRSFFPGVRQAGDHTLAFATKDYFEVLRLLRFMTM